MSDLAVAAILSGMILVASAISIELGIASAIIEIILGVIAGNVFHVHPTNWLTFIASFGSIVLTFLAGTEVSVKTSKKKLSYSFLIGFVSFLLPFIVIFLFALHGLHWTLAASKIAGIALSTTSLAVVYAILIETDLAKTELGKAIMAATFVTDFLTALALSVLFVQFNMDTVLFAIVSIVILVIGPRFIRFFFNRYKGRVIEPEIKLIFCIFFLLMFLAQIGKTEAILPVFLLGLLLAPFAETHHRFSSKMRTVAYAFITPFFFIKGGLSVNVSEVIQNWRLVLGLLALKVGSKIAGVYPMSRMSVPNSGRMFFTLLMSTGLTFGTIASTFGLENGYINKAQFSILISIVILSAILPTFLAQRFFRPVTEDMREGLSAVGEEGRALHSRSQ
jgi:Kef-type K+ transport system membrane component KefB